MRAMTGRVQAGVCVYVYVYVYVYVQVREQSSQEQDQGLKEGDDRARPSNVER